MIFSGIRSDTSIECIAFELCLCASKRSSCKNVIRFAGFFFTTFSTIFFRLTSAATSDEPQIIEFSHLIFHNGRTISQFGAPILIVACFYRNSCAVANIGQCYDFECNRKCFIRSPMIRQRRTQNIWATSAN